MPIIVYYHVQTGDEGEEIVLTSKDYFDANRCIDDGSGHYYTDINRVMAKCGCSELCESVFDLWDTSLETVKSVMFDNGYDLRKDVAFTQFLTQE